MTEQSQTQSSAQGAGQSSGGVTEQSSGGQGSQQSSQQSANSGQTQGQGQTQAQQGQQQSQAPSRPDWCPETCFDPKTGVNSEAFGKHWQEKVAPQLAAIAAEQVRRGALPQKPDDYKVGTTENFKPPQGVEFKINEGDPLWSQAKAWAHKHGLSQDAFHEAVDLVAGREVFSQQRVTEAVNAEIAKLGATGPARVSNIQTWMQSMVGPDLGSELNKMLVTEKMVRAFEVMASQFVTQGASSFSQGGREPQQNGRVSPEQYEKMSPADRLDYQRSHDQSKMPAWRDPRAA